MNYSTRIKIYEQDEFPKGYALIRYPTHNEITQKIIDVTRYDVPYKLEEEWVPTGGTYCVGKKKEELTAYERRTGHYIEYVEIPTGRFTIWAKI